MLWPLLDNCPDEKWHYYEGNYFYMSVAKATQSAARAECLAMEADLASISNQAEMEFVKSKSWVETVSIVTNGWSM